MPKMQAGDVPGDTMARGAPHDIAANRPGTASATEPDAAHRQALHIHADGATTPLPVKAPPADSRGKPAAPATPAGLPPECRLRHFAADCPTRLMLDQIADKWSMLVMAVLDGEPMRFNAIRRQLEGITQKALTQCLRKLERNGLITRRVGTGSPVAVYYAMTALGDTLRPPIKALYQWTETHWDAVQAARAAFDRNRDA